MPNCATTPLPPPPVAQASAQVTVTISGTASQLTFFTNVLKGNDAAAWAQIYSALTAAGISYVPGSLYVDGLPLPASGRTDIDVLIGIPIGVSLGLLSLLCIVAFRCFQQRTGARSPAVAAAARAQAEPPPPSLRPCLAQRMQPPSTLHRADASGEPIKDDSTCCSVSYSNVKPPAVYITPPEVYISLAQPVSPMRGSQGSQNRR